MDGWGYWNSTPKKYRKGKGNQWGKEQSTPKQPKNEKAEYVAKSFDGRRISVAMPSSSHGDGQPSLDQYKEIIKALAQGRALNASQQKLLEDSPRDALRDEQKELNLRRKRQNKLRNLEKKIEQNRSDYETWLETQRQVIAQEKARFLSEQQKLQKELDILKKDAEEEDPEEETMDELLDNAQQPPATDFISKQLEDRMLVAEQTAYHAQQSMLMMQSQLQQYHCALLGTHGMPPQDAASASCNSPQMPRVRKPGLKNNEAAARAKAKAAKAAEGAPETIEDSDVEDGTKQDGV